MNYPRSVPVLEPGDVGVRVLFRSDGTPCCAMGWFRNELQSCDQRWSIGGMDIALPIYKAVAGVLLKKTGAAHLINDNIRNSATRARLVNLTFIVMGYVRGQSSNDVRWVRRNIHKIRNRLSGKSRALANEFMKNHTGDRI